MSERKAVNKYYPPDWRPEHGSLNQFVKKRKLLPNNSTEQKNNSIFSGKSIRFELPFNIWCLGCERHLAKGIRFNARQLETGHYLTTKILTFSFKCPSCSQDILIKTDPANSDYTVEKGARRKNEHGSDIDTVRIKTEQDWKKEATDPFLRLQIATQDKKRAEPVKLAINEIQERNSINWKDNFSSSQHLRKVFREEKQKIKEGIGRTMKYAGIDSFISPTNLSSEDSNVIESLQFKKKRRSSTKMNVFEKGWNSFSTNK